MKLLADVRLPQLESLFGQHFSLTTYKTEDELPDLLSNHDILLCRSTLKVTSELLKNSSIQCVATASSGIDHIDEKYLKNQGIFLFDAKGCNARSVADYVVSTLAFLYQNHHMLGNKAGVIGVGEVGTQVLARLRCAGFEVLCFDPIKAKQNKDYDYCTLDELTTCDLLCIHANLHDLPPYPSRNLLDGSFLSRLKSGSTIINAARGGIVNESALLQTKNSLRYCSDVYSFEPEINSKIIDFSTLCTPHIAGHSLEAKLAAVIQISQQLHRHYGLSEPNLPICKENRPTLLPKNHWYDNVLELYNPYWETDILKTAKNKKEAFLSLRQAHQNRHDFIFYNMNQLEQKTRALMGHQTL